MAIYQSFTMLVVGSLQNDAHFGTGMMSTSALE